MCNDIDGVRYHIDSSVTALGRRWAAPILFEILSGNDSFNALLTAIPGVNPNTLSARLREYQESGLIKKHRLGSKHQKTRYVLTEKGHEMRKLIREIVSYSLKWHSGA